MHKIDIEQLSKETNLSLDEIAKLSGIKEARNLGKWNQDKPDGSRPNYNAIIRLLDKGATTKTLFGIDTSSVQKSSATDESHLSPAVQELLKHPEFVAGVEKAWTDVEAKKMEFSKNNLEG